MKGLAMIALLAAAPALAAPPAPPPLPVPTQWPAGPAYAAAAVADPAPRYTYADAFPDPRLQRLIASALAHNQDIAAALANLDAARAQVGVQRAALFPEFDASASYQHTDGAGSFRRGDFYTAQGAVSSWELDLFGRIRSLTAAARARYLASAAAARGVRITVVAQVANAWLAYAADSSLLAIARSTADAARATLELTERRVAGGIATLADQRKAEITLAQAEADIATQTTLVAQDMNALRLLCGGEIAAADLPASIENAGAGLALVPAGLPAEVLLRRPDVGEAEMALAAARANVGAARAALFPRITLSGLGGVASSALAGLFSGDNINWNAGAGISWPIFAGGRLRNGVKVAKAQEEAALAGWRRAVQAAFRDVSDVLARRGTISAQLAAAGRGRDAAADNARLTTARYQGGIASALDDFAAQQAAYAAARTLAGVQLAEAANRVALYRALGGDDPLR